MAHRRTVTSPTHCDTCDKPMPVGSTLYVAEWNGVEQWRCGKCNRKVKGKFTKEGW